MSAVMRPALDVVLRRAHVSVALIAVMMAAVTMTVAGLFALRVHSEDNLRLVARSMSYTVEAAVVFGDVIATQEAVSQIGMQEDIDAVSVVDARGRVLAQWTREGNGARHQLEQWLTAMILPASQTVPILHQGREIGEVHVVPHGSGLLQFLLTGLLCVVVCFGISTAVALYLSRRMERDITTPLHALANIAHTVRRDRSFDLRASPVRIAELNALNEDFNALLTEMQTWQARLQQENASLVQRVHHDSLTGLHNRAFFETELKRAIADACLAGRRVAVLFLDCDHFKDINDGWGHAVGDQVLMTMAQRIRQQLRDSDLVARLGGDEFAVLLRHIRSDGDAMHIAAKIIESMAVPVMLSGDEQILASVSIGVAVFPEQALTAEALLQSADLAMYGAKQIRRGSVCLSGTTCAM